MDFRARSARSFRTLRHAVINPLADESVGYSDSVYEEGDQVCPVDCVGEFKTDEEFIRILKKAKKTNSSVAVDFYPSACGSCKYIGQGFLKVCKGSGGEEAPRKIHTACVMDEYEEQSEVAERLRVKGH